MAQAEIGLEHEFTVHSNGAQVDFRTLIHTLGLPGKAIDPGDRYAYRLATGTVVTCDGKEAEIATQPIPVEPGWPQSLTSWAASAARSLVAAVPDAHLEGWSTHLSVSAEAEHVARAAGIFCRTFAPALMMLMEQQDGEGLLVRPRYRRVELGGDYVTGPALQAAAAMAVGGVSICLDVARKRRSKRDLPPAIKVKIEAATDRYGWYLDRKAFGFDLYSEGRSARFRREYFGSIGGQQLLEAAWEVACDALGDWSTDADLAAADALVSGELPLPLEQPTERRPIVEGPAVPAHAMGAAMSLSNTGAISVEAVAATWDYVVFQFSGTDSGYWAVPRTGLLEALDRIDNGELSEILAEETRRPCLSRYDEAARGGVFETLEFGPKLAPPEPGPNGVFRLAT